MSFFSDLMNETKFSAFIDFDDIFKLSNENCLLSIFNKDIFVFILASSILLLLKFISGSKVLISTLKSRGLKVILTSFRSKLIPLLASDILFLI